MASIQSVIDLVDRLKENTFDEELKMAWLTELNGFIALNIHLLDIAEVRQLPHVYPDDLEAELLVGYPHDGIYRLWLEAKIDYQNGEYDKYQNTMQAYNAALDDYERWFAETYNPGGTWPMGTGCHVPTHYITAYGLAVMQGYRGTLAQWLVSLRGGHYVPAVSQPEAGMLQVAFTPSGEDMPAVEPVTVALPEGPAGATPRIGDNGNWWTGDTDTGIKATGPAGQDGIGLPEIAEAVEVLPRISLVLPYMEEKGCAWQTLGTPPYDVFAFTPLEGHTYRVLWDDPYHDCKALSLPDGGVYFGNAGFATTGVWDADIPFVFLLNAQQELEVYGNSQEELDIDVAVSRLPDAGKLVGVSGDRYALVPPSAAGTDGGYYTPEVSQPEAGVMQVAFTPSGEDMPAVEPVTVALPEGPQGEPGEGLPEVLNIDMLPESTLALSYIEEKGCQGFVSPRSPFVPIRNSHYIVTIDGSVYSSTAQFPEPAWVDAVAEKNIAVQSWGQNKGITIGTFTIKPGTPYLVTMNGTSYEITSTASCHIIKDGLFDIYNSGTTMYSYLYGALASSSSIVFRLQELVSYDTTFIGDAGFTNSGVWSGEYPFALLVTPQGQFEFYIQGDSASITLAVKECPDEGKVLAVKNGVLQLTEVAAHSSDQEELVEAVIAALPKYTGEVVT